jgi:DNA-binding XRE family transcriptional regulator
MEQRVFLNRIAPLRMAQNLRQTDLADLVGVDQSTMCRIERGELVPRLDTAFDICIVLGQPPAGVFFSLFEDRCITLDRDSNTGSQS